MTTPRPKLLALEELRRVREEVALGNRRFVLTNGCFDILHRGHVEYLWESAQLGDFLAVAVNSDKSVRCLKGTSRPINTEQDRAFLIACLGFVDAVVIFPGPRLDAEIRLLRPDVYTKAGDYTPATLESCERSALEFVGAEIRILPYFPGYSTTSTLKCVNLDDA